MLTQHYTEYNSMLSQVHIQIASKITEAVLQIRLQARKSLFLHLQTNFTNIKISRGKHFSSLTDFLNALLPKDSYRINQKLVNKLQGGRLSATASIQVLFTLIEKTTGRRVDAQHWSISICRKKIDNYKESILMVAQFFEEVVLMLNKLPLFSIYHKEKQLKSSYCLDYKIIFENAREASMFEFRAQHFLQRQNEALILFAKVSYKPSLDFLISKTLLSENSKRKQSTTSSQYACEKKVSVYAFYDPELDFTFLSSDQEHYKIKGDVEQIKMDVQSSQISEQFQLLISNEDQDFLQESKDYFQALSKQEQNYMYQ